MYTYAFLISLELVLILYIRRALAQGTSDHELSVCVATFVTSVKHLLHLFDFVATILTSV